MAGVSGYPRHAELVSASIGPEAPLGQVTGGEATLGAHDAGGRTEGWTLKQVQGDDEGNRWEGEGHAPRIRPFTGRHMAMIMVAFFGVVIAVNVTMARLAGSTFGGVVVENSYVASQHFNRWLDEAAAEQALGWRADLGRGGDDRVTLALAGPQADATVTAIARHPLGHERDVALRFTPAGAGRFVSTEALPAGRWRLRLEVRSGGLLWRHEGDVR